MKEEIKLKVIRYIDYLLDKGWSETTFRLDLRNLRNKYIYKDISLEEFTKDAKWLSDMRKLDKAIKKIK